MNEHRLAALVDRRVAHAGDAPVGLGRRRAHLEHLDHAVRGVARAHRRQPARARRGRRADARLGEDAVLDEQPEAHRNGVEAAGDQPAVGRIRSGVGVRWKDCGSNWKAKSMMAASVKVKPPL